MCVTEDTILVVPGIKNISSLVDTRDGMTMTYIDWIVGKVQLNYTNLGLGSALDDVLLLCIVTSDVKGGLDLAAAIVQMSITHLTPESVNNVLERPLLQAANNKTETELLQ